MSLKKITAVIDELRLSAVEEALRQHGITGYSVKQIKGRGAYFNSYTSDPLVPHVQLDIYTTSDYVDAIRGLIIATAHVGIANEGLVSVTPVEQLYSVSSGEAVGAQAFTFAEIKDSST